MRNSNNNHEKCKLDQCRHSHTSVDRKTADRSTTFRLNIGHLVTKSFGLFQYWTGNGRSLFNHRLRVTQIVDTNSATDWHVKALEHLVAEARVLAEELHLDHVVAALEQCQFWSGNIRRCSVLLLAAPWCRRRRLPLKSEFLVPVPNFFVLGSTCLDTAVQLVDAEQIRPNLQQEALPHCRLSIVISDCC